jgi:hypothetical protein
MNFFDIFYKSLCFSFIVRLFRTGIRLTTQYLQSDGMVIPSSEAYDAAYIFLINYGVAKLLVD